MVSFTTGMKDFIVDRHNAKRNLIAGGTVANHKAACRMATMQWDQELANLVGLNVRQCKMSHDSCRNTDSFKHSGQNLAWMKYSGSLNAKKLLDKAVNMWYNEVKYSKMEYINSFPDSTTILKKIGHFTVMVADRNIRVGCAASSYTQKGDKKKTFLIGCNYATSNILGMPTYVSCAKAGTTCKKGKNTKYTNLCSSSEIYNVGWTNQKNSWVPFQFYSN
uniref:SCP domain-containing protein n=2 Tax=Stomoxys calcitrans TaxID=35570 RepID=A0A1I8PZV0_STOCA